MKTTRNITVTGTKATGDGLRVSSENAGKILSILVDLYRSPVTPVRELVINAIEAADEAAKTQDEYPKVLLEVETKENKDSTILGYQNYDKRYDSAIFKITDKGIGMSTDDVRNILLNITTSTKDGDDGSIGGFGIGAKAVFSIAKMCTWRTTKDGVTTTVVLSVNENGTEDVMNVEETGEENGTTVIFPVDGENATRILDRIDREFLRYADPNKVDMFVNGVRHNVGQAGVSDMNPGDVRVDTGNHHFWTMNDDITVVGMGGIPYAYTIEGLGQIINANVDDANLRNIASINNGKITVRMDIAREDINPSREALKSTERLDKKIIQVIIDAYNKEFNNLMSDVYDAKNAEAWRTALIDSLTNSKTTLITVNPSAFRGFDLHALHKENDATLMKIIPGTQVALIDGDDRSNRGRTMDAPLSALLGGNWQKSVYIAHYMDNFSLLEDKNLFAISRKEMIESSISNTSFVYGMLPKFITEKNNILSLKDVIAELFEVTFCDANDIREELKKEGREDRKKKGLNSRNSTSSSSANNDPIYVVDGEDNVVEFGAVKEITDALFDGSLKAEHLLVIDMFEGSTFDADNEDIKKIAKFISKHNGVIVAGNKIERRLNASFSRRKNSVSIRMVDGGNISYNDKYYFSIPQIWDRVQKFNYEHENYSTNLQRDYSRFSILRKLSDPEIADYFKVIDKEREQMIKEYYALKGADEWEINEENNEKIACYLVERVLRWSDVNDEKHNDVLAAMFNAGLRQYSLVNNSYSEVSIDDVKTVINAVKSAGEVMGYSEENENDLSVA